jgi:hypothetical protein
MPLNRWSVPLFMRTSRSNVLAAVTPAEHAKQDASHSCQGVTKHYAAFDGKKDPMQRDEYRGQAMGTCGLCTLYKPHKRSGAGMRRLSNGPKAGSRHWQPYRENHKSCSSAITAYEYAAPPHTHHPPSRGPGCNAAPAAARPSCRAHAPTSVLSSPFHLVATLIQKYPHQRKHDQRPHLGPGA